MDFALRCYRAVSYARAVLATVAEDLSFIPGVLQNWTLFVIGWTLLLASRVFALRESPR